METQRLQLPHRETDIFTRTTIKFTGSLFVTLPPPKNHPHLDWLNDSYTMNLVCNDREDYVFWCFIGEWCL